jgi:hypothetical protein
MSGMCKSSTTTSGVRTLQAAMALKGSLAIATVYPALRRSSDINIV